MTIKQGKPNAAVIQQNIRLMKIAEIKRIYLDAKNDSKILDEKKMSLILSDKLMISLRKVKEYMSVARAVTGYDGK